MAAPDQAWIHVTRGGHAYVLGPFSGDGIFTLLSQRVHLYDTKAAAQKAAAQPVDAAQAQAILGLGLAGPGIGHGFGLGHDAGQAGNDITSPLSGIDEIGAVLKTAFSTIADWHFWASLGWLVVGLSAVYMGIRLWLGLSATGVPNPVSGARELLSRG